MHHGRVAELIDPTPRLRDSFVAAVAEFHADREFGVPWFVGDIEPEALTDAAAFEAYVARLLAERDGEVAPHRPRAARFVPMTTLWWAEGDRFLARIAIRHRLTPRLERVGGNIGYDVRPGARRRGHATAMLAAALPVARSLGIDEALLTCDDTNTASRKVIEANGGRFIDLAGAKRRYRVATSR